MWNGFPHTFTPLSGFYVPALIVLGLDLRCGRDCASTEQRDPARDQGLQVVLTNLGKKARLQGDFGRVASKTTPSYEHQLTL